MGGPKILFSSVDNNIVMHLRKVFAAILDRENLLPRDCGNEISPKISPINSRNDATSLSSMEMKIRPILAQELPEQDEPWIHHAEPLVVA